MILFGHQTGNPNSHHAALALHERGLLDAFVVPWFPSRAALKFLGTFPPTQAMARRLERRRFEPLADARFIQGRCGEFKRLAIRAFGKGDEGLSYAVNDWLMRTMKRELGRPRVTAVHSPEDASLWQFEEAKRRDKACLYDMPIGYYPWWEQKQAELTRQFADWLPPSGLAANRWTRPEQKRREMELADLVLAPSAFGEKTIREFHPHKKITRAPYGVDLDFWRPSPFTLHPSPLNRPLRFIYAGQCSLRKGIPVLLKAWQAAALKDAQLDLVGSWHLAPERLKRLPANVSFSGPVSREELRVRYQAADVFVFPSFFEGFALAFLEAMACGLAVIGSEVLEGMDLLKETTGRLVYAGNEEALVAALRWFAYHRECLPAMKSAARQQAKCFTWESYRRCVSEAVASFA